MLQIYSTFLHHRFRSFTTAKKWILSISTNTSVSRVGHLMADHVNSQLVAIVNGPETREEGNKKLHRRGDIWLGSLRWVHGEALANGRRSVHKTSSGCLRLKLLSVTYIRRSLCFSDVTYSHLPNAIQEFHAKTACFCRVRINAQENKRKKEDRRKDNV